MEYMTVNGISYHILRLLGRGKGGYSYLAERDGKEYVLKQIHHEPCDYYSFGDKIEAERLDYERLKQAGIPIPRLLEIDFVTERILKEYVQGPTAQELIKEGRLPRWQLQQVRQMAERAKASGLNIDYYPTNFVGKDGILYYIDFECNEYMEEWSFESWGSQYWSARPNDE